VGFNFIDVPKDFYASSDAELEPDDIDDDLIPGRSTFKFRVSESNIFLFLLLEHRKYRLIPKKETLNS
jgi:hypothetical protein